MKIILSQDVERCAAIHAAAFPDAWTLESFSTLLASEGVQARMIDRDAFLLTRTVLDEMEILTIAVVPEARRKNYAQTLIQHSLEEAKVLGVQSCFLEVDQQNIPAIRCYEKLGFNAISIRKEYYKTPTGRADAVIMRLMLTES